MHKLFLTLALLLLFTYRITAVDSKATTYTALNSMQELYCSCGLETAISYSIFQKAMAGYNKFCPTRNILAICDFSKPSNKERFFIIDLNNRRLITKSLVAHGKNSGDLMATRFSNIPESLQSSLGFFRIGSAVQNSKHGLSLELDGLETELNSNARMRGIIMHGADYVSEDFVKKYGYAGKSFGCPALPNDIMHSVAPILKDGALLYICNE